MTNLNVYFNSCSSTVNCKIGCGTLGYIVLTAHPALFSIHFGTTFMPRTNTGIHPVMPDPALTATILAKLVRNHKHRVRLFNEYNAVDRACKRVISKLILEKFYKSLLIQIISFTKVTCLQILTQLITKYTELKDNDIQ